jgi:hypothetical protein
MRKTISAKFMSLPMMPRRPLLGSAFPHTNARSVSACRVGLLAVALLLCQRAESTLYLQDAINYPAGTQLGNDSPWASPNSQITVGSASLVYPNLADFIPAGYSISIAQGASGSYTYRPLSTTATGGSVYCSFLVNCTTIPGTSGYYIMGLLPTAITSPTAGSEPVDIYTKGTNTSLYTLGIKTKGGPSSAAYPPMSLSPNTTNLVVVKYTFSTARADLYINPAPGGAEPSSPNVTITGTAASFSDVGNLYVRSQSSSIGNWNFDTLRIASTWAEVTPLPNQPPTIAPAGQPQSTNVVVGATASFTVVVSGSPSYSYQWRKDGSNFGAAVSSSSPTNTLTLSSVATNDAGSYEVVITNAFGAVTSTVAILTVIVPPTVTLQPQAQSFCGSGAASFTSSSLGFPVPSVQWQVSTNNGANWADIPGATSTTYGFAALAADNGKQFRAVFSNAGGLATSSTATLAVNSGPVAVNISTNATQNQVFILSIATLLASCTAPDGDPFYLSAAGPLSTNGIPVTITATNTISYQPAPGFSGADRFTYTLTDILGCSASAEVQVTVGP